jgi:hypothetical protein
MLNGRMGNCIGEIQTGMDLNDIVVVLHGRSLLR